MDAEVEKTTIGQLIQRFVVVTGGMAHNTHVTNNAIINEFLRWWPHGRDYQVRLIRPSSLDEWLALQEPRLRNVSYNRYAGFLKQLFDIAVKDRIIAESPAKSLRLPWKKPQVPVRRIPTVDEFERIVENIRTQRFSDHAQDTADFVEFLGLAGLGQAEASSLAWGDVDWTNNRLNIRRHKTDTRFIVPIYEHLRPLLERLSKERRGKRSPASPVFKIKDAKKALGGGVRTAQIACLLPAQPAAAPYRTALASGRGPEAHRSVAGESGWWAAHSGHVYAGVWQ